MENQTYSQHILQIEGLKVTQQSAYPAFIFFLLVYIFTVVSNLGILVLIVTERSLHQPMYILFCNLPLNDAFGATLMLPQVLGTIFVPSADRYIYYIDCVTQAFCSHIFGTM